MLVDTMGLTFVDLNAVYIGGSFGNYLDIGASVWIGLLPDFPGDRFRFIGNCSLTGATAALPSAEGREKARDIVARRRTWTTAPTRRTCRNTWGAVHSAHGHRSVSHCKARHVGVARRHTISR
ncbi:DUF4445 domain-containing protein [Candidatus Poribacteria bacterium]|nr:DUF4445 domain-containing protein [Candidatus Poribacteria bacterium]MBT5710082.1 DUF4445 domain-containing protein [Candidatus Poribacteria bacterium]MBT7099054.1 DUF4445 domain-containing protein [Candidatus Poribacteria bacterium]